MKKIERYYVIRTRAVEKAIEKMTPKLREKYLVIENALSIDPYNPPNVGKKHFGKLVDSNIYHIALTYTDRIFYEIDNENVIINDIEFLGILNILKTSGHDF